MKFKTLGDYAKVQGGYAYKSKDFTDTGVPVLKIKNVGKGSLLYNEVSYVDKIFLDTTANFVTQVGDILISMTGSNINQPASMVGRVARVSKGDPLSLINQRVGRLLLKEEGVVDIRFLYYYLSQYEVQYYLVSNATGSANQVNINGKLIESIQIPDYDYNQTKKIAHILSTLDDKIELNRKMNETLEAMAQALFKSWFVDFDPVHAKAACKSEQELEVAAAKLGISKEILELFPNEFEESEMGMIPLGWKAKTIKDFGRVITGKTPPKKIEDAYTDKGKPFITPTDIDDSLFVTNTVRYLSEKGQFAVRNSKITAGSICVTCIGSQMGKTTVAPTDSFTNQQINSIVLTKDNIRNYLLCNLRGRRKEIFLLGSGGGSTMPLLNKSSFEKVDVLLPTAGAMEAFDSMMKDNINLVLQNDIESNNLSKLRDTLLPKLLSGEVEV